MTIIAALVLFQASAAVPNAAPAKAQLPTAKVECRMVLEAGSRIPSRICRLDKEWELLAKDAQDNLQSSRDHHSGTQSSN